MEEFSQQNWNLLKNVFAKWAQRYLGMHRLEEDPTFTLRLKRVCAVLHLQTAQECIEFWTHQAANPQTVQAVAAEFTVGESYFFRDRILYETLQNLLVPSWRQSSKQSVSIWSIGCSEGQEIYSVAMVLDQQLPKTQGWEVCCLATDINPNVLQKARMGVYGQWSFRQMLPHYKELYFQPLGNGFRISEAIKQQVSFHYHNILSPKPRPNICKNANFDLILVRNVFIYFDEKSIATALENISNNLTKDGFLVTTHAEYLPSIFSKWFELIDASIPLLKKRDMTTKNATDESSENSAIDDSIPAILPFFNSELLPEDSVLHRPVECSETNPSSDSGKTPDLLYLQALVALQNRHYTQAIDALRACLYMDESRIDAHIALANIGLKTQQMHLVKRHLSQAKKLLSALPEDSILEQLGEMSVKALLDWIAKVELKHSSQKG